MPPYSRLIQTRRIVQVVDHVDGIIDCDTNGDDGETGGNGRDMRLPEAKNESGYQRSEDGGQKRN